MVYKVYLICSEFEGRKLYKIGYTRRTIDKRIKEIRTGNGSEIYLVESFSSVWGTKIESHLHKQFMTKKLNGEWFDLTDEDLKSFTSRCESIHNVFQTIVKDNTYYLETGKLY
jgi:hypothetical protein